MARRNSDPKGLDISKPFFFFDHTLFVGLYSNMSVCILVSASSQ